MGYVGLPLAVEFGKIFETIGFDINKSRIKELLAGNDSTLEVESHGLQEATKLSYTTDVKDIQSCNIFINVYPDLPWARLPCSTLILPILFVIPRIKPSI